MSIITNYVYSQTIRALQKEYPIQRSEIETDLKRCTSQMPIFLQNKHPKGAEYKSAIISATQEIAHPIRTLLESIASIF